MAAPVVPSWNNPTKEKGWGLPLPCSLSGTAEWSCASWPPSPGKTGRTRTEARAQQRKAMLLGLSGEKPLGGSGWWLVEVLLKVRE